MLNRRVRLVLAAALACSLSAMLWSAVAKGPLEWRAWSADIFREAKAQNRFVILDLEAVWCHWCHVMEEITYADPRVIELLGHRYITVRVDQDANPDLSNRYGDWGWPATIIFAADGSEIVKRRGYIAPQQMASLLEAVINDPSPGPSVVAALDVEPAPSAVLPAESRQTLLDRFRASYDPANGGWGTVHKFIDADSMDLTLAEATAGNSEAAGVAKRTLDQALALIDREWGGIYQYSDRADWRSPHYEKIMWYQANGLRQYAAAYALFKDVRYLDAARDLYRYLTTRLSAPSGAFLTSQDADVDRQITGKTFYAMSGAERNALGREPRIDTNVYARENGWAISGLVGYANATGDPDVLARAERAGRVILDSRRRSDGLFLHGETDRGGPFLGDTLAMGQAALDLYGATGGRDWLMVAAQAGDGLASFKDEAGGFRTTLEPEADLGVFASHHKSLDEQVAVARFANRLNRTLGRAEHRELALHAMRYLASEAVLGLRRPLPGVILANDELANDPLHLTIVGGKDDPAARLLLDTARAYPAPYKRVDWWDRREGPMANPDVRYPELAEAAAFVCTNKICSLPIVEAQDLAQTIDRIASARSASPVR